MSQGPHVDYIADESQRVLGDTAGDIQAAIDSAIAERFPIGAVYMAEDGADVEAPADALGYGTWVELTDETIGEDDAARTFKRWLRVPGEEAGGGEEAH